MELPNVVGTPHLGNRCVDSVHEVMDAAIEDALAVLHGKRPRYLVNPDVYTRNQALKT
jgi:phosphoglycerate dehydrogenase-like enzyme